jgi:hypothetical protein
MTWYPFRKQVAWNRDGAPVQSGSGAVYAVSDIAADGSVVPGGVPLVVRAVGGGATMASVPIEDFLTREFEAENHTEVYWKSGTAPPVWLFSAVGMADDAAAARAAAELAANAAYGPTDETAAALLAMDTSLFRAAMDARYGTRTAIEELSTNGVTRDDTFWAGPVQTVNGAWANTGDTSVPLFAAPYPMLVNRLVLVTWAGAAIALSDTSYWRVVLRKQPIAGGAAVDIAYKTTRATASGGTPNYPAGQVWTPRVPWTFDTAAFGAGAQLAAGDILYLATLPVGTPGAIAGAITANVGYRRT